MRLERCLLATALIASATVFGASDRQDAQDGGRIRSGLLALYDFRAIDDVTVSDRSGLGDLADFKIGKLEDVVVSEGSVELIGPTTVRSKSAPAKIADMVRISGELTVEAWLTPTHPNQTEPATAISISNGTDQRNLIVEQLDGRFRVRFRTSRTGRNAGQGISTASGVVKGEPTHFVFTRGRLGQVSIFVDGALAASGEIPGATSLWEKTTVFLGNEPKNSQPWLGTFYLFAIYGRDLSPQEVGQNFRAGPSPASSTLMTSSDSSDHFESKIAPLLARRCLECHDSAVKKGGLDLSRKDAAFAGGVNGKAIKPGDASGSLLWLMSQADAMPKDRPSLSSDEKQLLRDWIDAGAPWTYETLDRAIFARGDRANGNWVQRLTAGEYIETVRAALGVDVSKEAREVLPPDLRADGFNNTAYNLNVDLGHVEAYARLAAIVGDRIDVAKISIEEPEATNDWIAAIGKRILRGPISEHEIELYSGLVDAVTSSGGSREESVRYVAEAMLQSPRFIYRIEQQRGDGSAWPTDVHEFASRLSYIVWGAPPDPALMAAADAGDLTNPSEVKRQTARMLRDDRAIARSVDFVAQWLDLDRLANLQPNLEKFPRWDPALAADMRAETLAFVEDVIWSEKQSLAALFNSQFSYLTPQLAEHYGIEPRGDGLTRYDLSGTAARGGLLTQGSVLTLGGDEASMVTRGLFVLKDILFGEIGSPPPGLDTSPVPTSPGRSHRAIAMERVKSGTCGGCHSKFEPLAFGLEKFDGLGSFHDVDEHGNELREDGEILFPGAARPVAYSNSAEMMDLLADNDRVMRNVTRKLTQFALGRPLVAADEPSVEQIHAQSTEGGGTYQSLITAIVMSDLVTTTRTEF